MQTLTDRGQDRRAAVARIFWGAASSARRAAETGRCNAVAGPISELCLLAMHEPGSIGARAKRVLEDLAWSEVSGRAARREARQALLDILRMHASLGAP